MTGDCEAGCEPFSWGLMSPIYPPFRRSAIKDTCRHQPPFPLWYLVEEIACMGPLFLIILRLAPCDTSRHLFNSIGVYYF